MYLKILSILLFLTIALTALSADCMEIPGRSNMLSNPCDTIPTPEDKSRRASARDENKLISELEFYKEKTDRLNTQIAIAEEREKSYKEQLEIINLNKVNYTLEYIDKIQSEYNTNTALVKALKAEEKINSQKLNELLESQNNSEIQKEKIIPVADLQVSASNLAPGKNLITNRSLNPPGYLCTPLKLKEGSETPRELLLNFTDPKIQQYLRGENYISCFSKVSKHNSGTIYLSLTFTINSNTAKKDYGQLESGSACVIYFLSGESITLKNTNSDAGRWDSASGMTVYEGVYILDSREVKLVESNLSGKIRIVWSTGYEDYEVHDLALIGNQIKCL